MQKIDKIDNVPLTDILLGIIVNKPEPLKDFKESKLYSALYNICKNGSKEILERLMQGIEQSINESSAGNSDFIYSITRGYAEGYKKIDGIYFKLNADQLMAIKDSIFGFYDMPVIDKIKEVSKKVWDEYHKIN